MKSNILASRTARGLTLKTSGSGNGTKWHSLASELTDFVLSKGKAPVWHGNYTTLFDGSLSMVDGEYLVLTRQVSPPDHSTGFWIPDENLYSYYDYFCYGRSGGSGWRDFAIKHVGIERIPSGVIRSGDPSCECRSHAGGMGHTPREKLAGSSCLG